MNARCEEVRLSAMAQADGETPILMAAEIEAHLAQCPECRREVAESTALSQLLDAQRRPSVQVDVWPAVALRLPIGAPDPSRAEAPKVKQPLGFARATQPAGALILLAQIASVLLASQVILLSVTRPAGVAVRLAVLVLLGVLFLWRRENPFHINPELSAPSKGIRL